MKVLNRRNFIQKSAAASVVFSAPLVKSGWAKNSPNDTINMAVVGIRGRGRAHIRNWSALENVNVVAICDVDENLFIRGIDDVAGLSGKEPKTYVDYRDLLEDKDIDAVSIATPDHWHALQTIWGCQAGKDVYVEKPLSYTLWEGRKMIEAARKYKKIVQIGTQHPSDPIIQEGMKYINDGILGDLYMGKAVVYDYRADIGQKPDTAIPDGVNWDLYLGPAPYRPFNENRFHYNWHWFWDTSSTEFGNNGTHWIDLVRRAMGKRVHPVEAECMGGTYGLENSDRQIPNLQAAHLLYDDGVMLELEVRNIYSNREGGGSSRCALLYGTKGWMYMGTSEFKIFTGPNNEPGPAMTRNDLPADQRSNIQLIHFQNFIDCVRSREWQDLTADVAEGHYSTTIVHLANIAYRTGRRLSFNPYSEQFINDDDANTYLKRTYREPYVVPDVV